MISPDNFRYGVNAILDTVKEKLVYKSDEYWRNSNPYHNFEEGAKRKNKHPAEILKGFLLKHEISIDDFVNDMANGKKVEFSVIEEKITDLIIYNIILLTMFHQSNDTNSNSRDNSID